MSGFEERLESVKERIDAACARAGRSSDEINLVAVSKTRLPQEVSEAAACGVIYFGENKVQEAEQKIPMCPGNISWHLVGHLQSNKVRRAVQLFDMIHSADSLKVLRAINSGCEAVGKNIKVMLEVNVSGELSKFGVIPDQVERTLEESSDLSRVEVVGLMTMPPFREDPEEVRPWFQKLARLRGEMQAAGYGLDELSMGMSNDFDVAIEEGATWIRIGTLLFGARK
ncbi:MAG: YggS family pyridoxal phosphate-dependent enzyme [Lentisphaerae bacterium]|nr:YggS family pyridoxal phosphate-dependent enzyme [Lentisphaerota bacterium]